MWLMCIHNQNEDTKLLFIYMLIFTKITEVNLCAFAYTLFHEHSSSILKQNGLDIAG